MTTVTPVEIHRCAQGLARSGPPKGASSPLHQPQPLTAACTITLEFGALLLTMADVVGISEVYAAGEGPHRRGQADDLGAGLIRHGHRDARAVQSGRFWRGLVREEGRVRGYGVLPRAGTISTWANALPGRAGLRFKRRKPCNGTGPLIWWPGYDLIGLASVGLCSSTVRRRWPGSSSIYSRYLTADAHLC